jgi:hypothetical protein
MVTPLNVAAFILKPGMTNKKTAINKMTLNFIFPPIFFCPKGTKKQNFSIRENIKGLGTICQYIGGIILAIIPGN